MSCIHSLVLWSKNIGIIKGFSHNIWFANNSSLMGELAMIDFYSKITGLSKQMAVQSFGLVEIFILGLVIYWILTKIAVSNYIAPIIGVLLFALFYEFLPINLNTLLEHNSLYLAFCFVLPAMIFTVIPNLLFISKPQLFFGDDDDIYSDCND